MKKTIFYLVFYLILACLWNCAGHKKIYTLAEPEFMKRQFDSLMAKKGVTLKLVTGKLYNGEVSMFDSQGIFFRHQKNGEEEKFMFHSIEKISYKSRWLGGLQGMVMGVGILGVSGFVLDSFWKRNCSNLSAAKSEPGFECYFNFIDLTILGMVFGFSIGLAKSSIVNYKFLEEDRPRKNREEKKKEIVDEILERHPMR